VDQSAQQTPSRNQIFGLLREHVPAIAEKVVYLVDQLSQINKEQWDLEDTIRDCSIEPHKFVAIKNDIDVHNIKRNEAIQSIDSLVISAFQPPLFCIDKNLFVNSESIGRLIDRIIILMIRNECFQHELSYGDKSYVQKIRSIETELTFYQSILVNYLTALCEKKSTYGPECDIKDYKKRKNIRE